MTAAWRVDARVNTFGEYRIFEGDTFIGFIAGQQRATLAAAAPVMADALHQVVALADGYQGGATEFSNGRAAGYRNVGEIARAALAAAGIAMNARALPESFVARLESLVNMSSRLLEKMENRRNDGEHQHDCIDKLETAAGHLKAALAHAREAR